MRKFMWVAGFLLAAGCAGPGAGGGSASVNYGPAPSADEARGLLLGLLKDPSSAEISGVRGPTQGWAGDDYGWKYCANVNAKNAFGGYTGAQGFVLVIRNGAVIGMRNGRTVYDASVVRKLCEDV
jgi:hypothetical protein